MHRSANGGAMAHQGKDRCDMGHQQEGEEGAGEEGRAHETIQEGVGGRG